MSDMAQQYYKAWEEVFYGENAIYGVPGMLIGCLEEIPSQKGRTISPTMRVNDGKAKFIKLTNKVFNSKHQFISYFCRILQNYILFTY